ncbi:TonB-dependent receptor [Muribaculum intestinale]|nr:TonB-dependent receptor [Muribaculum intestinale]PWB09490.1 TonB-dependent receptor [Muribaculum intestinale]QQR09381.1 TonB-dependent receptor [Muribaculum intestinale]
MSLASVFARIQYNYDSRYLLSASLRADGSSRFGSNNRWGYFPSVSAG